METTRGRRGFSHTSLMYVLIFIFIIAIIAMFFIYHKHQKTPTVAPASTSSNSFNQYTNPKDGNTLIYHGTTDFAGVYGTVVTNSCPVQQTVQQCPPAYLKDIRVTATNTKSGAKIAGVSDSKGSYRIVTGDGSFKLTASPVKKSPTTCKTSGTVEVANSTSQRFDIHCDNGLR